jgi:mono/diheme cytochrome c family protein
MNSKSTNGLVLKLSVLLLSCLFFSQLMRGVTVRAVQNTAPARQIDFNRDIRPILADRCWSCHGPDAPAKKIKPRLDSEGAATADLGGGRRAIVPGNPEQSQLVRRITSGDEMMRMPPVDSGRKLTQTEIDLLVEWVRQGARWQHHWSFITPIRPLLPRVKNKEWPKNAIDQFVLERLEREGMEPSPEADRATLIRRVSLDLTGLPPTRGEVEDFLNDKSPDAYEKVVDRLLANPRYGERMAFSWLDAARYADTNGYQVDGDRSAWRWRDWVIEAFNQNKPFDQFVVEQLAGDLLPNATLDQKIATAFNRNHRINAEGGVVPEEYRVEYVVDRVDTTSTVFMGLTLGCARCHNHKYDPFTQKEYYQLTAYFNSIDEDGHSFDQGNSPPVMAAPTNEQQRRLRQFIQEIAQAESHYNALAEKSARAQRRWEKSLLASNNANQQWFPDDKLIARLPLDAQNAPVFKKSDRAHHDQDDRRKDEPERKFEVGFKEGSPRYVESPTGQGVTFDGKLYFDAGIRADFRYKSISKDYRERFTIATWVYPESEQSGSIITKVSDAPAEVENNVPRAEGYGLYFINGKIHFNMVFRWGEDALRVETEEPLPPRQWRHIAVVFDGLKSWEDRLRIFVNGREAKLKFNQRNFFMLSGGTRNTLKIGAGGGPQFRFKGALDEVRIYSRALDQDEIAALACADSLEKIAAIPAANRSRAQSLKIQGAFLEQAAPDVLKQARDTLVELKRQKQSFEDDLPTLMIMEETPQPRPTSLLKRGAYDAPGEKVERGVPATLPPLRRGGRGEAARIAPTSNRLDFARWLVSAEHPLTGRVAVNRFWQTLFGAGLVRTTEDFGTQGELPSHPELLDWLAVEFRDGHGTGSGSDLVGVGQRDRRGNQLATARGTVPAAWDVKALLKTMVMSATYRQSSKITPQSQQRDPDNRLLARGPRFRLPAEMIRDQALFVSGLLVEKLGGPSVKPYQPDGLYKDMAFSGMTGYDRDEGEGLWRRSLYTFWKRTVLSPTMRVFDASAREYCTVRETRTNTPLQSLNLMNDVTYVEAARLLAQRMLREGGATPQARVAWAFLVAASRRPSERELQVLLRNLSWQMDYFGQNPREATRLLSIGEKRNEAKLDAVELAAYSATASLILNLDEVITKQ